MKKDLEETKDFNPQFNSDGLIPCITTNEKGVVLMMAWMNREAFLKTLDRREMYYWSRSRNELWHKGATSGHVQKLIELRTDCDQDCLLAIIEDEPACHTGRHSCFYRTVDLKNGKLNFD